MFDGSELRFRRELTAPKLYNHQRQHLTKFRIKMVVSIPIVDISSIGK